VLQSKHLGAVIRSSNFWLNEILFPLFSSIAFPHLSLSVFEVLHKSSSTLKLIATGIEKPQGKSEGFIY
jgi:hypothetical protein